MNELMEMGTISTRGQIAIPVNIRKEMGLHEGNKVLFLLEDDTLIVKKITRNSFGEVTATLKEAAHQAGMQEKDVPDMIARFRSKNKR